MECFGTTDFDNNSRLITLSAIIISSLHCSFFLKNDYMTQIWFLFLLLPPACIQKCVTVTWWFHCVKSNDCHKAAVCKELCFLWREGRTASCPVQKVDAHQTIKLSFSRGQWPPYLFSRSSFIVIKSVSECRSEARLRSHGTFVSCLTVCPRVSAQLPLYRLAWNFMSGTCTKFLSRNPKCGKNPNFAWRRGYVLVLPITLNRRKSAFLDWNGTRLLEYCTGINTAQTCHRFFILF
jgi:hypothetical protein